MGKFSQVRKTQYFGRARAATLLLRRITEARPLNLPETGQDAHTIPSLRFGTIVFITLSRAPSRGLESWLFL